MSHSIEKLLEDISLSCHEIKDFIDGLTFEGFQENRMLQLAVRLLQTFI